MTYNATYFEFTDKFREFYIVDRCPPQSILFSINDDTSTFKYNFKIYFMSSFEKLIMLFEKLNNLITTLNLDDTTRYTERWNKTFYIKSASFGDTLCELDIKPDLDTLKMHVILNSIEYDINNPTFKKLYERMFRPR